MGDIAYDMGWDGVEFRLKNAMQQGFVDEFTPGESYGLIPPRCPNASRRASAT